MSRQCTTLHCGTDEAIFDTKTDILVKHPFGSPSLASCDFFQFPPIKPLLKWTHFELCSSVHHMLKAMSEVCSKTLPSAEGKNIFVLSCGKKKL
jgi:hypothetical protein